MEHMLEKSHWTEKKFKAIDAEASSIRVSVDTEKFSIQVNDNGIGIENMSQLGRRHGEEEIELCNAVLIIKNSILKMSFIKRPKSIKDIWIPGRR